MQTLVKKSSELYYQGKSYQEIYEVIDRMCLMKMISATTRRDYVETALTIGEESFNQTVKQYKIDECLREESEIADKSTLTDVIESSTPASLEEAIKEAHNESKGKD